MAREAMTREELLDAIQTCRNANCVECRYKDVGGPCVHALLEDIAIAMKPIDELVEAIRHCITKDCVNCPYAIKGCERAMLKDTLALLECEYEAAVEERQYCERYEPTYNPEDGSM